MTEYFLHGDVPEVVTSIRELRLPRALKSDFVRILLGLIADPEPDAATDAVSRSSRPANAIAVVEALIKAKLLTPNDFEEALEQFVPLLPDIRVDAPQADSLVAAALVVAFKANILSFGDVARIVRAANAQVATDSGYVGACSPLVVEIAASLARAAGDAAPTELPKQLAAAKIDLLQCLQASEQTDNARMYEALQCKVSRVLMLCVGRPGFCSFVDFFFLIFFLFFYFYFLLFF